MVPPHIPDQTVPGRGLPQCLHTHTLTAQAAFKRDVEKADGICTWTALRMAAAGHYWCFHVRQIPGRAQILFGFLRTSSPELNLRCRLVISTDMTTSVRLL